MSGTKGRLARIPARIWRDVRLVGMLRTWREALAAEWTGARLERIEFRNGVVLSGPSDSRLEFLFHEIWVRETYNRGGYAIREDDTIIDVGANVGVFAAYAASRAPRGRVLAFEPFPRSVDQLRENVRESRLRNVEIFEEAVAGSCGRRTLHVSPEALITNSLVATRPGGHELAVDCVDLDHVLEANRVDRCDLLKLDCEGSEYEVLQGCSPEALGRVARIVGEYHEGPGIVGDGDGLRRFLESRSFRVDHFEAIGAGSGIFRARNLALARSRSRPRVEGLKGRIDA